VFPVELKERASQLIHAIRPAAYSEARRTGVTEFMREVISESFQNFEVRCWVCEGCEVHINLDSTSPLGCYTPTPSFPHVRF
jgi:hypothetical protein